MKYSILAFDYMTVGSFKENLVSKGSSLKALNLAFTAILFIKKIYYQENDSDLWNVRTSNTTFSNIWYN